MRIRAAALLVSAVTVSSALLSAPAVAAPSSLSSPSLSAAATSATARPKQFLKVTAQAGPGVGQVTFSWQHDGRNTTGYVLETALTQFSKSTTSSLPRSGRHDRVWAIPSSARSFTMSAEQLEAAGAPVGSGNHLYFRLYARNANAKGTAAERAYPYLGAVLPRVAAGEGTDLRIASFNVRTARATDDARPWLQRRTDVAKEILTYAPEVVALQELGPGRADGKTGSLNGTQRQTDSLMESLGNQGGSRYKMVRSTPYVEPGKPTGTQGMRIVYDSSRASLVSRCSETTGNRNYSSSCSIVLPLLASDPETSRRRAAYAEFRDLQSGKLFYVVSTHLDTRHDKKSNAKEAVYNKLRAAQMQKIIDTMASVNTQGVPMVVAGDMNSWQAIQAGNGPHDALVDAGFSDTAAAPLGINLDYATFNGFDKTQHQYPQGFGARLDLIMTKGFAGATRFENVTNPTDSSRPSDHNMIVADTVL